MTFNHTLLLSVIGFIVGFIFQTVVTYFKNKSQTQIPAIPVLWNLDNLLSGFISYVFAILILNSYIIQTDINALNHKAEIRNNPYENAKNYIFTQSDDDKDFYNLKMGAVDDVLSNIASGDIIITREEIFQFWEKGFQKTLKGEDVLATNLVTKKDWDYFGPNGDGNRVQNEAIKKGVTIKRVMLMGKNIDNNKDLLELGKYQIANNVQVKKIDMSRFDEPRIQNDLNEIGNTKDFVVFGNKYLLVTFVDEDFKIKRAIFSTNSKKVKSAIAIYNWIWNNSMRFDEKYDPNHQ